MELHIPDSYTETDREQFQELLDSINWQRDACCGGEYFRAKGWDKPYEQRYADGAVITEMVPRQVAIHTTDNRYYIDPTFFKPAKVDASAATIAC